MTSPSKPGPRAWMALLSAGVTGAVVYVLLPYSQVSELLYVTIGLLSMVAVVVASRRGRLRSRAWTWLAAGLALSVSGDLIWLVYELQGMDPFPSAADVAYLAAYPLYAIALWELGRRAGGHRGAMIDALIIGVSAAVVGWAVLLVPYAEDPTLTLVERVVSLAYPVGDLVLVPLIARLVFLHGAAIRSHLLLLVGMGFFLTGDVIFGLLVVQGTYVAGGPVDALWLLGYVCFATAAWHPSARLHLVAAPDDAVALTGRRLVFLAAAAVLAPVTLLFQDVAATSVTRVAAVGSIALFLLVLGRMVGLVHRVHQQADALRHLSTIDHLTGAANRRQLETELERALARSDRDGEALSLALLDLDHFKAFNDQHGHQAGDAVLRALVGVWRAQLRGGDLLARFGGEEFVVLLPGATGAEAREAIERLRSTRVRGVTASAGLAHRRPGESADELLRRADAALSDAKARGRDRTVAAADNPTTPAGSRLLPS